MKKFFKYYDKIETWALMGSLIFTVILTFIQVIMRFVFNNSLSWSEELNRYIFIWQIWLGASIGFKDNKHIKVDFLVDTLKGNAKKTVEIFADILLLSFCIGLTYYGYVLVLGLVARNSLSVALKIPMALVYAALPFSSLIICFRLIIDMVDKFKSKSSIDGGEA